MTISNILQSLRGGNRTSQNNQGEGQPDLPADTSQPTRVGLWVLGLGLGGFILWAAFAPLDEGVPTMGTVTIDTKRKPVQHPSGGIIREIHVKEGDQVAQGQLLIKLDDAQSRANYETIRQHYLTLRAIEGRLLAEQAGHGAIIFHPDLIKAKQDPIVAQFISNQQQLLQSRRAAREAEDQAIHEAIRGQQASLKSLQTMLPHRVNQLALLREEFAGIRDLVAEGYAPRSKRNELERTIDEVSANIADTEGNIARLQRGIEEQTFRSTQRRQEYLKEVNGLLVDIRREVQADADKFKAASDEFGRVDIRATVAGQVVGLAFQTVGGVVQPSQKLMDIVPANEELMLETHVPPHLIDRVQAGQFANIRFSGFAHSPQLVVQGKILSISSDLLSDPSGQQPPYYLARVAVTAEGRKELGQHQLQAGMPAEVVIKTGERTLLTYLLHPLAKRLSSAMVEE
ncbi:MAG: HlyD family type I secretion periplasmic adaptor subunit [Betaproteobacteria bacterium]|nr:HlyD family type I secretion periplasmic adaptor subunit [Betaproteobacteria bacterium]